MSNYSNGTVQDCPHCTYHSSRSGTGMCFNGDLYSKLPTGGYPSCSSCKAAAGVPVAERIGVVCSVCKGTQKVWIGPTPTEVHTHSHQGAAVDTTQIQFALQLISANLDRLAYATERHLEAVTNGAKTASPDIP